MDIRAFVDTRFADLNFVEPEVAEFLSSVGIYTLGDYMEFHKSGQRLNDWSRITPGDDEVYGYITTCMGKYPGLRSEIHDLFNWGAQC